MVGFDRQDRGRGPHIQEIAGRGIPPCAGRNSQRISPGAVSCVAIVV